MDSLPAPPPPGSLFHVAISFATRDVAAAQLAAELHAELARVGLDVFYYADIEEAAKALGERLGTLLPAIYRDRALLVVLIASPSYGQTHWTRIELSNALERPHDDSGQPRLVPISADGSAIEGLPDDVLHLGSSVTSPQSVAAAARLIAQRCGVEGGLWRHWWPLGLPAATAPLIGAQLGMAGATASLTPWVTGATLLAVASSVGFLGIPRFWMARRKKAAGRRLVVVTEGPRLAAFRRATGVAGVAQAVAALALLVLVGWTLFGTRVALRDVRLMAEQGAVQAAMRRFATERGRLADFTGELIPLFDRSIENVLPRAWVDFPALYREYLTLARTPSARLEAAFWKHSGVAELQAGDDVLDHIQTASSLKDIAPDLAGRVFETALARLLEWQMSGNEFYYGGEGKRAWSVYARLEHAEGTDAWVEAHRVSELDGNPGLTSQIAVYLARRGDTQAHAEVERRLRQEDLDPEVLASLAETKLPPPVAQSIARAMREGWAGLHRDGWPTPEGFRLAEAYGFQGPAEAEPFLMERAQNADGEQERAHALSGLYALLSRGVAADPAAIADLLASAKQRESDLERSAAAGAFLRIEKCTGFSGESVEAELRVHLEATPRQNRAPAGVSPPPTLPAIDPRYVRELLAAYRIACGTRTDPVLVESIRARFGAPPDVPPAEPFAVLRQRYEEAAPNVPGSAYEPKVLEFVGLLEEMGRTQDPQAADFLDSIFPNLPHGNMSIAAAEALVQLRGRFGAPVLERVRELVGMSSSVYRNDALAMIGRTSGRLTDPAERTAIVRIVAQTSVSGEAAERGRMLDVLGVVDPELARRRAFSLAFSSSAADRLEGIERLWELWQQGS